MRTLLITLLLAFPAFGQLDYSPKPENKESALKMHFAIKLFRGTTKPQEEFLRRAIRDRRSISETEAAQLFTTSELRDVFFAIGREDVSVFKRIYEKDSIVAKKTEWFALTKEQKVDVRRINFAWAVGYVGLNDIQIDYLERLSKKLPTITKKEAAAFETEALELFTKETGSLIFGSIGPYKSCRETGQLLANCWCSVGSSFNMQCEGSCTSTGTCTATSDGCGFAWLYSCGGTCPT